MDFSYALQKLREGLRIRRAQWYCNSWIALGGTPVEIAADKFWNPHTRAFAESNGGKAVVEPYLVMLTSKGTIQMGWAPSQEDVLAQDWRVVL